jgi:hypothetical protein
MCTLVREHRYVLYHRVESHVLRVEELVSSSAPWPEKFRLQLPASRERPSQTFYGATSDDAAKKGAEFLSCAADN